MYNVIIEICITDLINPQKGTGHMGFRVTI